MGIFLLMLASILVGFCIGYMSKGITITINHKDKQEIPVTSEGKPAYNEDYSALLPTEVQEYYEQNNGFMK